MTDPDRKKIVRLAEVTKSFGPVQALQHIDLDVYDGEILTLLGPSGCGKTTLMRLIAGFEQATSGRIFIDGKDVTLVPPEKRPVNLVFQRYALFPHLDVFDNIAFGLRIQKLDKEDIRSRVHDMLRIVQMPDFADRWTHQLSGGQAQRVALARALVNKPAVLLLDEPLAALDLKIRQQMLIELKRIHAETHTTFVYVTHDQDEAMILSDRIVLMNRGGILQIDRPEVMYARPRSLFCAQFLGETNLLPATVVEMNGKTACFDIGNCAVSGPCGDWPVGSAVSLSIRPETLSISERGRGVPSANRLDGSVTDVTFIGNRVRYQIRDSGGRTIRCEEPRSVEGIRFQAGSAVTLSWPVEANVVLSE
jgi:spermidine/putrescine transport system ATP-binding protein